MEKSKHLISCPIFKDELGAVLPPEGAATVHFMDSRIHNNARRMKEELLKGIAKTEAAGAPVRLLVGNGCHCGVGIGDLAKTCNARFPEGKNCIEIILGFEKAQELQANRSAVVTQGWIRMITTAIEEGRWTEVDARTDLGWFDRIVLADYGLAPLSDEQVLTFFDIIQVPIEIEPIALDHFQGVVEQLLE